MTEEKDELEDEIEWLNSFCDNSLSITKFITGWEIASYKIGSSLNPDVKFPYPKGRTIGEAIYNAVVFVSGVKKEEKEATK